MGIRNSIENIKEILCIKHKKEYSAKEVNQIFKIVCKWLYGHNYSESLLPAKEIEPKEEWYVDNVLSNIIEDFLIYAKGYFRMNDPPSTFEKKSILSNPRQSESS